MLNSTWGPRAGEEGRRIRSLVLAVFGVRCRAPQERLLAVILGLGEGSSRYRSNRQSGGPQRSPVPAGNPGLAGTAADLRHRGAGGRSCRSEPGRS